MNLGVQLCGDGIRVQICEPEKFAYTYEAANALASPIDGTMIYWHYSEYDGDECTGNIIYSCEYRWRVVNYLSNTTGCEWTEDFDLDDPFPTQFRDDSTPGWVDSDMGSKRLSRDGLDWILNAQACGALAGLEMRRTGTLAGLYTLESCDNGSEIWNYTHPFALSARALGAATVSPSSENQEIEAECFRYGIQICEQEEAP